MDDFTKGYIQTALWTEHGKKSEFLDADYGVDDIDADTLSKMEADCKKFQQDHKTVLRQAYKQYQPTDEYTVEWCAGSDFWYTRNHHGVGFLDRKIGKVIAEVLSHGADSCGEYHLFDDDGIIVGE